MKLSLATQTPEVSSPSPVSLLSGAFEEKMAKAADWGAYGLELMPVDPTALDVDEIRLGLEQHDLEAAAVGTVLMGLGGLTMLHTDPDRAAQAQDWLRNAIDFASAVGAPLVTIGSFRGRVASVGVGGRERLGAMLQEAATYAEPRGVQLALEPINHFQTDFITNAEEGLAFVGKVDHPALGLLLDTCHMNIEESSWTQPIRRVMDAGKLWHVHLADNNRQAPGRGLIDFRPIITALYEVGYTGYLSVEVLAQPDPDTAAQDALAHMRPLLEI